MASESPTFSQVVGPERYQRRIAEWLSLQPAVTGVTEIRENSPGGGLFTGLSIVVGLNESAHATEVDQLASHWVQWRGSKPWTLSLAARVSIILAPGTRPTWIGDVWAALMADERLGSGSAISPRIDGPGAALLLHTDSPALPVLWSHLNAGQRGRYRPRRAIAPPEPDPHIAPAISFNLDIDGCDARYWLTGSPDLLLACRPALEGLTAAVEGSTISGIFHSDDFGVVTVWARDDTAATSARWAWDIADPPCSVELRIERPSS